MARRLVRYLAVGCILFGFGAANAQGEGGATEAPTAPATPAEPAAAPPAAPASSEDERIGLLQGQLEALESQLGEVKSDASILKNLKFSGYIQARYQYAENSKQGIDKTGAAQVKDGFSIRRGRFKATYTNTWSQYLLQIDATGKGIVLKDAEVHLIEPWSGYKLELVVGQTKWPFGYEVAQSSSDREFPERTRVVRAFAAGERDRGGKLLAKVGPARLSLGIFDGNGIENKGFIGVDNDMNKDGVGRVGFDFKWIAAGVSGWYGKTLKPGDWSGATPVPSTTYDRTRVGADLQIYLDALPFGATALKGEYIAGRTYFKDGVEQFDKPANGWYALLVQNLGLSNALAVRYDEFDGNAGGPPGIDSKDPSKPAGSNRLRTVGFAAMHYWDEVLKISAVYEIPITTVPAGITDPKDNLFTLQLQAKF